MKKSLLISIGAALTAATGATLFALVKKYKKNKPEITDEPNLNDIIPEDSSVNGQFNEIPASEEPIPGFPGLKFTDFSDPDHLIFCDESNLSERLIQLDTTFNMREIGGYTGLNGRKTVWGKVIRSEELTRLSDNDLDWLSAIGVKHVYDFRDAKNAANKPDRIPEGADYTNLPVLADMPLSHKDMDFTDPDIIDKFMSKVYAFQVENKAQEFATVLKALAKDETPILYHCTNGKDRTGFMTALILLICGVPESTIVSDYTLTNLTFDHAYEVLGPVMSKDFGLPDKKYMHDFFGVFPHWIQLQLDYIRENYESVDDYLLSNTDITQEEIDQIRDIMLEKE